MSQVATAFIAFTAAAAILTVTPGLDTALVLRTATSEGSRRALSASLGICAGCLLWGLLVALGLGALLAASELAYTALRWTGAAYLLYLGLKLICAPRTDLNFDGLLGRGSTWFWRGLLTNILNPKIGIFYLSFLPQFIPPGVDVSAMTVALAGIHASLGLIWFFVLIVATRPIVKALQQPTVLQTLDRITGSIFILFGLRIAFGRN